MIKQLVTTTFIVFSLAPISLPNPLFAQPVPSTGAEICLPFQLMTAPINLAATFSSITSISGDVQYFNGPMVPPMNFAIPQTPGPNLWRSSGSNWLSFHTTPAPTQGNQIVDIVHGQSARIYPGLTNIPSGTGKISVVRVAGSAMAQVHIFNLTICGKPASTQICTTLNVSQASGIAGRFSPSARIPLTFPATAKIVSLKSTNMTVAANGTTPAETQPITNPTTVGQPKTANYPVAMQNRHFRFFMVPSSHEADFPIDTWRAQGGQPRYLTIGAAVKPGWYVTPVNSWQGPAGAADNPSHGIGSGTVELCVE